MFLHLFRSIIGGRAEWMEAPITSRFDHFKTLGCVLALFTGLKLIASAEINGSILEIVASFL